MSRRGPALIAALQLALLAPLGGSSCSESTEATNAGSGSGSAPTSRDAGAAADAEARRDTEVSPSDIAALERPDEVPPLRLTPVRDSARRRARSLNVQGLRLYGQRRYRAAISKYIAALRADPGHILARYNLSCAYNLVGEPEKGLALLVEFKNNNCRECRERLIRASEDADWHSMWDHPLFVEIVGVQVSGGERATPFWQRGEGACPPGARRVGEPPPNGREVYCARGRTRVGEYARWHGVGDALAERGQYTAGARTGVWKQFDTKGKLSRIGPYRSGKKHGVWSEWHASGGQAVDGRFVDGLRHGRWTWFDESGTILKQANFERGRRGAWMVAPKDDSKPD